VSQRGDRAAIAQLQFQGGSFDDPSRIRTMTGYRRATQRARVHVHTIREVARLALRLEGPLPSEPEHAPGGNRLVRMREDRPEAVDLSVRFGGFESWSNRPRVLARTERSLSFIVRHIRSAAHGGRF
jgi:hypothetical protein